jgi:hypothetical protein
VGFIGANLIENNPFLDVSLGIDSDGGEVGRCDSREEFPCDDTLQSDPRCSKKALQLSK